MATIKNFKKSSGVTLIEILLILTIISSVVFTLIGFQTRKTEQMRNDRFVLQIKEILNAAMAYYVGRGSWPLTAPVACSSSDNLGVLQTGQYLPTGTINNPWGNGYTVGCIRETGEFSVSTNAGNIAKASIAAGRVPNGFVSNQAGQATFPPTRDVCTSIPYPAGCTYVVASVSVPGQNRMNARGVNFASVYHSGACVPAPFCPSGMVPRIFVMPVSATGANSNPRTDDYNTGTCTNASLFPLSSYTAIAYPGTGPVQVSSGANVIRGCESTTTAPCYQTKTSTGHAIVDEGQYWRVCLYLKTNLGAVAPTTSSWGQITGSVLAITRCVPASETEGAGFLVWQR